MAFGDTGDDADLRAAWHRFCDRLRDAGDLAFKDTSPANALQRADAFRFLTQNLSQAYDLEYGSAEIEIHAEDLCGDDRVLVVDDVLATGGTAEASLELIRRAGARVAGVAVLMELGFLSGRARLAPALDGAPLEALLTV